MSFDQGQYERARELLTPLAEGGNLQAQEVLYAMYTYGYGVEADPVAAFGWLRRSAEQGHPAAQESVGRHYLNGTGVARDEGLAVHWFQLSAQQNFPAAIYNLGVLTMNGQGVATDPAEAWRLFERAAALDDPDALYVLGGAALQDIAVTGDIDTALGYLSKAARLGQRRASALLGVLLEDFPEVPDNVFKSALHYHAAIAAGCDDISDAAARVAARLSPDELKALQGDLAHYLPKRDPRDEQPVPGHCLAE
ncbi:MAG: sel1 repeat family protein [Alphaproteobacteria bacterium]|nr:sel1 repeat family protein [Alphaproteobacteria bacterium]